MSKDVYKELAGWLESSSHFGHEKLVILHVLKELNVCQRAQGIPSCDEPLLKPLDQNSPSQTHSLLRFQ